MQNPNSTTPIPIVSSREKAVEKHCGKNLSIKRAELEARVSELEVRVSRLRDVKQTVNISRTPARLVVITPTYSRPKVLRKFTLSHMFVSMCDSGVEVWWYVIDDSASKTIPSFSGCPLVHMTRVVAPPRSAKSVHRAVDHRNTGLGNALRDLVGTKAAVFFADDDNLYSPGLWAKAAQASQEVIFWPVGFMEYPVGAEAPVYKDRAIHGFQSLWCPEGGRRYGIDMAGFAVPLDETTKVRFQHTWPSGFLETRFLEELERRGVRMRAVESDVLAWHVNWSTDSVVNFTMHVPSARVNCRRPALTV